MARVTYAECPGLRKTSITLQDGCFGAGALMRIAAMFVRPDREDSVQTDSELEMQAVPVAAAANPISMPEHISTPVTEAPQPYRSSPISLCTHVEGDHVVCTCLQFGCQRVHALIQDYTQQGNHAM